MATPENEEAFTSRVKNLILEYPPKRIINIDKMNWRSESPGSCTSAPTGTESVCCRIERKVYGKAELTFVGTGINWKETGVGSSARRGKNGL
jgi:hypothetical protein